VHFLWCTLDIDRVGQNVEVSDSPALEPTSPANPPANPPAFSPVVSRHTVDLMGYLDASPSPFHAIGEAKQRLDAAGFSALSEDESWSLDVTDGACYVERDGALIAWVGSAEAHVSGWRIIGAHTDSPNLRLKPNADTDAHGYRQLAVEIYGGALNNSWLDRDLGVSGRLLMSTGESLLVRIDRAIARVAQLAIHLDREVNDKGLVLDKQLHLLPISGLGTSSSGDFVSVVARACSVSGDVAAADLMLHDLTPAALLGTEQEFLASARIDNLFSCWAAITALTTSDTDSACIAALFDHEEVGSASTTGAAGPLLERVMTRLASLRNQTADDQAVMFARSICLSVDMAHAVHPNYADRHEPGHRPLPNGGPVLKVNSNQRYATSAKTAAMFRAACDRIDVPLQVFTSKNSMPCGSTIGPVTATRLGIDTVDIGCAMLSMHSARELCGATDPALMLSALISALEM
jgi:aspartyl aminopeptidase